MKKVLIDLYHLPQYNFFRNAIQSFDPSEVVLYCVDRGKLAPVIRHELPEYTLHCIGDYRNNKGMGSMIFKIILPRMWRMYREITPKRYDFVITAHYQANVIARLRGIPNVALIDDPRRFVFPLLKWAANEVFLPPFDTHFKGVKYFNALKEWAYLSPSYFRPNPEILNQYGLKPKSYIFVREVSTKTSNYLGQEQDIILSRAADFPSETPVMLSLENKENRDKYPSDWTILKEPVEDIHSLMFYSKLVISSGDSVAREGAMLGVPALYAGFRDMPANRILIKMGMLEKHDPEQLGQAISAICSGQKQFEEQQTFRNKLKEEWQDVTGLILDKIKEYR